MQTATTMSAPARLASVPADSTDQNATHHGLDGTSQIRVLIADPDSTVRKILRHVFSSLQWEAIEAADGEEVLKRVSCRPSPHAILLDLNLPKVNGYEVCRRIKADIQNQTIPVVALTTVEGPEEKMQAVEAGVDEFLSKPINHAELQVRLRSLIRVHRFNQELIGAESVAMALARAVASKDGYSNSHVEQVAHFAAMLGESLGLDSSELKILRYGGDPAQRGEDFHSGRRARKNDGAQSSRKSLVPAASTRWLRHLCSAQAA